MTALREHYRVTHSFCFTSKCPASLHVNIRASDNSQEKNSNLAGFAETNSRRKRPISREFRVNFGSKFCRKTKKKEPRKKIYWKDVKFRARKKTQKFIQHSSEGNCTCFERQEKHKLKLYRNARPVNLLFQLQFRAEQSNAINFFSLLAVLCCFAAYKARLLVIECSNPFVKSKHRTIKHVPALLQTAVFFHTPYRFNEKSSHFLCANGKLVTLWPVPSFSQH